MPDWTWLGFTIMGSFFTLFFAASTGAALQDEEGPITIGLFLAMWGFLFLTLWLASNV